MSDINGIKNVTSSDVIQKSQEKKKVTSTSNFSSYLGETQSLDDIFNKAAEKYNVPVELLKAVGKAESGFNANAVSSCGAQGIMQLMPSTAASLGVKDAFDAEQNIMGGAKYLSQLLDKYDGNTSYALAAYNAGMGNVAKYGGIPPFEETKNYVKKVMGYMKEGVDTGNATYKKGTTTTTTNITKLPNITQIKNNLIIPENETQGDTETIDLSSIFSYDDYMKFLEIFYEEDDESSKENNNNYFTKAISYNASIMNLFK